MSDPFVGEIKMFAGNFAPAGWALCNGQLLAISEYDTLFNLIGTTYGGDGQQDFALPDLQGRVPIHMGQGPSQTYQIGEKGGVEQVTLSTQHIPTHSHVPLASSAAGTSDNPAGGVWAASSAKQFIVPSGPLGAVMAPLDTGSVGGSQPHDNMLPYLTINFIISLFGIFPSQT
jgi:microcystin-dependent protein